MVRHLGAQARRGRLIWVVFVFIVVVVVLSPLKQAILNAGSTVTRTCKRQPVFIQPFFISNRDATLRSTRQWAEGANSPSTGVHDVTQLTTEVFLEKEPQEVIEFLMKAANWPDVVISSLGVSGQVSAPLAPGDEVFEYFGVPLLWTPSIRWTCKTADRRRGILSLQSAVGVAGVADDCCMSFQASALPTGGTRLRLNMSYRPLGLLARIARPLLELDNALALKALLPWRLSDS